VTVITEELIFLESSWRLPMRTASITQSGLKNGQISEARLDPSTRAHRAALARQASARRRCIDPTTCERDYTADEIEFMNAMETYKLQSGRMFPTWSEALEVLKHLGYRKPASMSHVDQACF
jgi:hypothetical protein